MCCRFPRLITAYLTAAGKTAAGVKENCGRISCLVVCAIRSDAVEAHPPTHALPEANFARGRLLLGVRGESGEQIRQLLGLAWPQYGN
jgi:hypothetical protein